MATKVLVIQLAAQLHVPGTLASHNAGTAQPVKRVRARGMFSADYIADNIAERGILIQGNKDSPQVVSVRALVASCARHELDKGKAMLGHLMESALGEEGLSAEQRVEALQFALVAEREAVAPVQFTNLVEGKVGQHQARSHIKRRLVHVGDEE